MTKERKKKGSCYLLLSSETSDKSVDGPAYRELGGAGGVQVPGGTLSFVDKLRRLLLWSLGGS